MTNISIISGSLALTLGCSAVDIETNFPQKNDAIFLVIGGQSNTGTDPNTGRILFEDMPDYLQSSKGNIYAYDLQLGSTLDFAEYVPQTGRQMGWIDQLLYQLSFIYRRVYFVKRGVGGTTLATTDETYPRADLIARANNAFLKINELEKNYDLIGLWGQGESDGIIEINANAYQNNLSDWFDEWRLNILDMPIILNKVSEEQGQDVPYYSTIQNAQDAVGLLSDQNIVISADGLRTKQNGDYSHFSVASCIEIGNRYADEILTKFGKSKAATMLPVVVSASIDEATPNVIYITLSKTLAQDVVPFASDFILPNRNVKSYSISGNILSLTIGERYYSGDVVTLQYVKNSTYNDTSIQDRFGNQLQSFSGLSVNNNTTTAEPIFTLVYDSDFTASTDGFLTLSGSTLDFNQSIGGVNGCLKYTSDGLDIIYRSSTISTGETYRILFDIYCESSLSAPDQLDDGIISILRNGNDIVDTFQEKIKYNEWYSFRNLTTATGSSEFRFQMSGVENGTAMYIKNLKIYRQD